MFTAKGVRSTNEKGRGGLGKESSFANERIFPYRSALSWMNRCLRALRNRPRRRRRSRGRSFSVAGQRRFWGDKHGQGNKRILLEPRFTMPTNCQLIRTTFEAVNKTVDKIVKNVADQLRCLVLGLGVQTEQTGTVCLPCLQLLGMTEQTGTVCLPLAALTNFLPIRRVNPAQIDSTPQNLARNPQVALKSSHRPCPA